MPFMKKHIYLFVKILFLGSLALLVAGCVYTQVFPEEKHTYTVVTKDMNEIAANNAAMEKATKICKAEERNLIIIDHKSLYQGATVEQKRLAQLAKEDLLVNPTIATSHDYKVIFKFKCVPKY